MKDKTPLYHYSASYAQEHGEFEQYQASLQSNIACRKAIEKAISAHYRDYILGDGALQDVLKQFDYERILFVLAVTVQNKDWDGRISRDNKLWAQTISIFSDKDSDSFGNNCGFVVDRINPGLMSIFLSDVRNEYEKTQEKKPSVRESLNKPQMKKKTETTTKQRKTPER